MLNTRARLTFLFDLFQEAYIWEIDGLEKLEIKEMNNYRKSQQSKGVKEFRINKLHRAEITNIDLRGICEAANYLEAFYIFSAFDNPLNF